MFDIGWSEMLVVGAVALVVIGPKDLPAALRQAGKWMGAVRRMAADFQGHVNEAMREAELDELRKEVSNLKAGFDSVGNPAQTVGNQMRALVEKPIALPPPEAQPQTAASEVGASAPAVVTPAPAAKARTRTAAQAKAPAKPKTAAKPKPKPRKKTEAKT